MSIAQLIICAHPARPSLKYLFVGLVLGVAMDSVLIYLGIFEPQRTLLPWPIAPLWLIGLWVIFITYTRTGLDGLRGKYIAPAVAGCVGGPLAWMAGNRMGACEIYNNLLVGYGIISLSWGVICVVLFKLSDVIQVRDE